MSSPRRVYLDYNATAPLRPEVRAQTNLILEKIEDGSVGNPSSVHYAGRGARKVLEEARTKVARAFGRKASEVTFTGGGTEADNLAILGVIGADPKNFRIVTTPVEHPAVRAAVTRAQRLGAECIELSVSRAGELNLDELAKAIHCERRVLLSVMAANNETGVIHPIDAIAALAAEAHAILHVDAIQSAGRLPLPTIADLIVLSGHKLGGLPGTGALIGRERIVLDPQVVGGAQERGKRAGTEWIVGPAALSLALELSESSRISEKERLSPLKHRLERAVVAVTGVEIVGEPTNRLHQTTSILVEGVEGDALMQVLDLEGIAVSTGSACSSGSIEPSPVLKAMGLADQRARSALRVSMGYRTTADDVERFLAVFPDAVARCRAIV